MSDVFISYKAEDRARVRGLVEALEADGLSVWWDAHIGGGDDWRETIARELDGAGCVIVIWSKRSVGPEGRFVRDEAERALRRNAYLPVRIDKVDPPLGFGETQALPLVGWKGSASDPRYLAVLNAAQAIVGHAPTAPRAAAPSGIRRRTLLVGSAGAAAAVGLGGLYFLWPDKARANSIVVLPFANLSGDPSQAYFSDGMAEELRSALSRIAGLKVVARTSSEMLRDSDAKSAADKLGVGYVVNGSVRRSPSTIRVNAQLIDGGDGIERWSETFDRPAGDLLEIQTSIAQNVAQALSVHLAPKDHAALTLGGTRIPAAQELYLRSQPTVQDDTQQALEESVGLLNAAIALDPNFAQAHARKAFLVSILAGVYAQSRAESRRYYREALAAADRAIAIAPRLAVGHSSRAAILRDHLDMGGALAEFRIADALPDTDAHSLRVYAQMLAQSGKTSDARTKLERSKMLDPLNLVSLEVESLIFAYERSFAKAEAAARRGLERAPQRAQVRRVLGNSLLLQGKTAEARAVYSGLEPTDYRRLLGEAILAARAGDRPEALAKLGTMQGRYGDAALYQYAEIYAQLGMIDEAISELEKAYAARDPGVSNIRVNPFLDPLRNDPRFKAVEARLNFPD